MNNIDLYIQELETSKVEIKEAIIAKGVTPEGGLSSYAAAIDSITIPNPTFEELSVQLTENGTYNYTPTEDGYSSVEVVVDVDIPTFETETLTVELTENGTYNYTPTKDGYSSVEVVVDVASSVDEGSLYDFTTTLGVDASTNVLLNDAITADVNYTKSLEASYVKPSWQGAKLYYNNTKLRYGPRIDTSGLTSLGNNRDSNSASSQYGIFQGCSNLIWVPSLDTSSVTDFGHVFAGCYTLQRIEPMDFSKCINLSDTFRRCINLEELPFSTPLKITYNNSPFFMCQKLKHIPYIDTSNCTYFGYMYSGCIALESPIELDLTKAQTWGSSSSYGSSITINGTSYTYYDSTFGDCRKVPSIKLLNISPNCKYWNYMFYNCYALSNLEMTFQEGFAPTHAAYMFQNCQNLEEIPWFDTSKITNAQSMFGSCYKLKRIPNCDFGSCTSSYYPSFSNCRALEEFGGDLILSKCTSLHGSIFTNVSCPIPNIHIEAATSASDLLRYYTGTTVGNIISPKVTTISLGMVKHNSGGQGWNVETIGTIDASAATGINLFSDYTSDNYPALKNFGGFINYGMKSNASSITNYNFGLSPCNNLTHTSLMNIINNLYDRATAGYSVLTIKFHPDALARLSDDDIAIATSKGWTISK